MTLKEKQSKLQETLATNQIELVVDVVESMAKYNTSQLLISRVIESACAYLQVIKKRGRRPRMYAEVYQEAASQLSTYTNLVQIGVSRFRCKNTRYTDNNRMLAAIVDKVIEQL